MITAELKFECKSCIEDITISVEFEGKPHIEFSNIRKALQEQGWSIGRDCYCPTCLEKLTAHCSTCENYEGNKSMGAPLCRLDGKFCVPTDYCKNHEKR